MLGGPTVSSWRSASDQRSKYVVDRRSRYENRTSRFNKCCCDIGVIKCFRSQNCHFHTTADRVQLEKDEETFFPLFVTELLLEPSRVEFTPDKSQFQDGMKDVLQQFQTTSMRYQNLIVDSYFDAFTRSA